MGDEEQVRRLLEDVLNSGLTPEDACRSHPEHLEEVRRRWSRIRALGGDLDRVFPPARRDAPADAAAATGARRSLPRIPGYEIESTIGHGGMGVVFKARHLQLDRVVAVKMLLAGDHASGKELAGLVSEARAVAGLRHPNIVEVHDAGEVDGLPWFTMELVEGGSLAEKLKGVPLAPRDAASLVRRLAAAIQVAHEHGIVHRDLKPGNILLTADGTPKISDFGLARRTGGDPSNATVSARWGTPSYMAPEQALGKTEAFHPRVDVYALGAILYESLTGRPPFRADSPVETHRQVITEEVVPPSRINRRVSQDLETICLKCLQKNPTARYATASELGEDLRRCLDGEPITARKTSALVRGLKWARRHPATTTALGFAVLVSAALVVGAAWYFATTAASRHEVEGDLDEVERAQRASEWSAASAAMDRAGLRLGAKGAADLRARLDIARRNAGFVKRLDATRMIRAFGAGSHESFERSDREYAALYRDVGVDRETDSPERAARQLLASNISAALIGGLYEWLPCVQSGPRGVWPLAVARIADASQGDWRDRSRDPAVWNDRHAMTQMIADARVDGASTPYLLWFAERVRDHGVDSTALLRKIQRAHSDDFWANELLAFRLHERGDDLDAMRFYQAAMALRPEAAIVHGDLGNSLRILKRYPESIDQLREAVRLDPSVPVIRGNLGLTLSIVGRYGEALEHLEFGCRELPLDPRHHIELGLVLAALDRESEAIEQFRQAADLGPGNALDREGLIGAWIQVRRGAAAVSMVESWIKPGSDDFEPWNGLAELCLFVGERAAYEKTRESLIKLFGSTSDPALCERVSRACLLAPMSDEQRAAVGAMIDRTLDAERRHPPARPFSFQLEKGWLQYRSGDLAGSLRTLEVDPSRQSQTVIHHLIAAMALARIHRTGEALSILGRLGATFDCRTGDVGSRDPMMCHILRREAASIVVPELDQFVRGAYWPTDPIERLTLITTTEDRRMHLASAKLFSEAMAGDPTLTRDVDCLFRFRAACAAAMCGCGRSGDDPPLEPAERARWRAQSLEWLRAEFTQLRQVATKAHCYAMMINWRTDPDLRGVRTAASLAALPEGERQEWNALWADVDGILAATTSN
jgi:serine/threonine-protein kinase